MLISELTTGLCNCGCGQKTPIATVTRRDRGYVKGQPTRFCHQHNAKRIPAREANNIGLRWCYVCKTAKTPDQFYRRKNSLQYKCKACSDAEFRAWKKKNPAAHRGMLKKANLKRNYGMTMQEHAALFERQSGKCALCSEPETRTRKDGSLRSLHVDHDHQTGKVRGLLCHYCNTAIGAFRESEALLAKAIEYLRTHKQG